MKNKIKKITLGLSLLLATFSPLVYANTSEPRQISSEIKQYQDYNQMEENLGAYYTVEEYHENLRLINKKHPDITELQQIGESIQKQPIYALKISDKDSNIQGKNKREPQLLITAQQHANELIGGMVAMETAKQLTENYSENKNIKKYVDNNEIYIVPLVNPDGLKVIEEDYKKIGEFKKLKAYFKNIYPNLEIKAQGEGINWRKNTRDNDKDTRFSFKDGVDLNRNYSIGWERKEGEFRSSRKFPGQEAFSEPETKAIKNLAERLDNLKITVDLHSRGGLILYPPGYKEGKTEQDELYKKIAEEMKARQPHTKYEIVRLNKLYYYGPIKGSFNDWMHFERGVLSFGIETYHNQSIGNSVNSMNPPQQNINKVTENVMPMLFYLMEISENPLALLP